MRNLPPNKLGKDILGCEQMDVPLEFKQFIGREFYYERDSFDDWIAFEDTRSNPLRYVGRGKTDKEAILALYEVTVNPKLVMQDLILRKRETA